VERAAATAHQTTPGGGLPPHRRPAFADIAELLGNSPDAARRAATDGLKTLRKHYRKDETV